MLWYVETFIKALPAFVANMTPVFLGKFNIFGLRRPIDGGKIAWDGKRWLGDGKTWQGLIFAPIAGLLTGLLLSPFNYSTSFFGFILGLGAIVGDALGSFTKRRLGMPRGANAGLLDSLDFISIALLFSYPFGLWRPEEVLLLLIATPIFHRFANIIGYKLKLKREPW